MKGGCMALILEKISLDFSATKEKAEYFTFDGFTPAGDYVMREDEKSGFTGRIGYQITDWLTFSFKAGYEKRNSNIEGLSYRKRFYMAQLEFRYRYFSRKYYGILFEPDRRLDLYNRKI